MKNNQIFRVIGSALLFIALLLAPSCKKEYLAPETSLPMTTDKSADLIAFFDPLNLVLYVEPDFLEAVLAELNAKPLENGLYLMESNTYSGELTKVRFMLSRQKSPSIVEQSIATEAVLQDLLSVSPEEVKDIPTMKESYKNHRCEREVAARAGVCHVIGDISSQTHYKQHYKCTKVESESICTETHKPIGENRYYRNRDCQAPHFRANTLYGFRCD